MDMRQAHALPHHDETTTRGMDMGQATTIKAPSFQEDSRKLDAIARALRQLIALRDAAKHDKPSEA